MEFFSSAIADCSCSMSFVTCLELTSDLGEVFLFLPDFASICPRDARGLLLITTAIYQFNKTAVHVRVIKFNAVLATARRGVITPNAVDKYIAGRHK